MGVGKGWDRYRLGHPAVEVLAQVPPLNVQSGHSKVLHQGSSCAAMGPHPEKGEGIRRFSKTNTTEILHVGTFAGHTGHRPFASFVVERVPPQGAPTRWEPKGTKREILREGILRDVFSSQRTSSAWQGMQPQRLTVSLLLPGMGSKADEWLDFMQRQRQFWPTMTTRHASLAPIEMLTFQRERRLMQSKHLWDTFSIDWYKLDSKLYCSKPTGHSRELLWTHLFVQRHRQNPFQEREYQGDDTKNVYNKWYADQRYMYAYKSTKTLRGIDVEGAMMGFNIENLTAKQALLDAKDKHARRWQTKEGTYRLKGKLLPDVRDTDVEMADTSTGPQQSDHSKQA